MRWAFARKLLQDAIDQQCRELENMAAEYDRLAAWHRQKAEEQRLLMEQAVRDMEDAQKKREEIAGILDDAKSNGKVDRERARRFLAGMDITFPDDASDAEILALLREADKALQEKQSEASARHDNAKDKAEDHLSEAEELEKKAREMLAERDRILDEKGTTAEANEELTKLCERNKEVLENKEKIKDETTRDKIDRLEKYTTAHHENNSATPHAGTPKIHDLS